MSQSENKTTQTEEQKIKKTLDELSKSVEELNKQNQQQAQNNFNQQTQQQLQNNLNQQIANTNAYLQTSPFNSVIDINTSQGQQMVAMIQAQDPRIKVVPIPNTHLLQITFNDKPIYELNNEKPIKRVNTKIETEKDESNWEYLLAGFIILITILSCVLAFVNLNKQIDEIKQSKEDAVRPDEQQKKEDKPITTEQKDNSKVDVKEEVCVATTEHRITTDGTVHGNCDPTKTDVKGVELTDDAKQALNTVANPNDRYTITSKDGTQQTAYNITGSSDGQIHWRDVAGKTYHADKNDITITNKGGQQLSDCAENIMCDLTWRQRENTNVVDWYYNSTTKIEHNPSTGNVIDLTYQNNNSTWGSVGITQGQIGTPGAIGTLPLSTLQNASQQTNIGNTFLAPFSVSDNTLKVGDLSTSHTYADNTCIGSYDGANGFSSNIGENKDLRQAIETENRVLADDSKLQYNDANGNTQTLHDNVFGYEVNKGKITVKYDYDADKGTYKTNTYNLSDYNNLNIASDNANSQVSNTQLNLANNVQKYIDPNSGKTYVYADGLKATTIGKYGDNNYTTNFTLGDASTTLSNLTADGIRSNETLTNMYNNNNKLYNYIRLNEGYDNSKFTTNSLNNYNQVITKPINNHKEPACLCTINQEPIKCY